VSGDNVDDREKLILGHESQSFADTFGTHFSLADRYHLVSKAQSVAHGAIGGARDHRQRVIRCFYSLVLQDGREPVRNVREPDALEIEALETAENGCRCLSDFLGRGRRKDEYDARWRLLQNLEQRIPRLPRQHVRFVDDVDLEAIIAGGSIHRPLAQVTRIVHAAIRCRIDLHYVQARRSTPDALARDAFSARLAVIALVLTIQRHRENAGERRLAHSARSAEKVAVRNSSPGDGATQRVRHVRLDSYVSEAFWAVFAGECERHC
jgi:hypothetical protein